MSTEIKDIVLVNITRETAKISRVGFGTPLIFGIHSKFVEDYRIYTSITGVLEDFLITDEEYKAANAIFAQAIVPERIVIGKRSPNIAQSDVVTISNVQNNVTYSIIINGTSFDYLSDADATNLEIALGLVTAINLGAEPVTATDNVDGTFDLDADVPGEPFTTAVSDDGVGDGQTIANPILNVNVASELSDLIQSYNDFYAVINTRRATEAEQLQDIEQTADFIEAQLKVYAYAIDQATMITSATTDIASILKAKALDRTFGIYSADHDNYPEAAWLGGQLPKDPGSITWAFKTLVGITPDVLSENATFNLRAKNGNFYEDIANLNQTSNNAVVASGEYIDIIRGVDWLQARMSERIFTRLVNTGKVPFTSDGISAIETDIRAQLDQGVVVGFITDDYIVNMPDIDSIDPADKALRFLTGITFTAILQGAIHKVRIDGKVTL
jgi:hypothetical protein